jgi:predicted DNA-binding protein (MmcQ/YjbR family)
MTNGTIREHCLGLPFVTEVVRWEEHLLFKVGGRMFAMIDLDGHSCSLRCTPEMYAELVELADVVPCSHNMWKYHWVTTETLNAVPDREFRALLTAAYQIVRAGLPKAVRAELDEGRSAAVRPTASKKRAGVWKSAARPGRTRGGA